MYFLPRLIFFSFVFILLFNINSEAFSMKGDRYGRSSLNEKAIIDDSKVASIMQIITVDKNGFGNFNTIQAAIDSIPPGNNKWIKIQINAGIYTEKVTIPLEKPYIYLQGQGRRQTIITFNDHGRIDKSATFTSIPNNVVAKGITFENFYNRELVRDFSVNNNSIEESNNIVTQAVAARIYGDKSAFFECGFVGLQDTLWDATGRHYYNFCYIEGAIDFIFGDAQSYFEKSSINVTVGKLPPAYSFGYITAQGRASPVDTGGFVFRLGSIFGSRQVLLGRAYGPYSRVIFHGTYLGTVVAPLGWDAWFYQGQEDKFTYAEVDCEGPGSNTFSRVTWEKKLSYSEMKRFYSRSAFIDQDGWIDRLP